MALWIVLKDFVGKIAGSAEVLAAAQILDDAVDNVPALAADGCPVVPWGASPAEVSARNAFLGHVVSPGSPIPSENLLDLLIAFGGIGVVVPAAIDRRDHSVNGSYIEYWNMVQPRPILHTRTNVSPAGGYNGGGTGNKAILGHFLSAPMPLGSLLSLDWSMDTLTTEAVGVNILMYANLLVEMDPIGDPGNISILVLGDRDNVLNLGTYIAKRTLWTPSTNFVMVVNDKKMATFPIPPGPIIVPTSQGGVQTVAAAWQNHDYSIANILAAYPNARIVNASSLDGGMPKTTITSGISLVLGSSGSFVLNAVALVDWKLNGSGI